MGETLPPPQPHSEPDKPRLREVKFPPNLIAFSSAPYNEPTRDRHILIPNRGRFVLFDYEGKSSNNLTLAGEVAFARTNRWEEPAESEDLAKNRMVNLFKDINQAFISNPGSGRTTATGLQFIEEAGKIKVVLCNIGDSRAWRFDITKPPSERLEQLTQDDDLLHEGLPAEQADIIAAKFNKVRRLDQLSEELIPLNKTITRFPIWDPTIDDYRYEPRSEASEVDFFYARFATTKLIGHVGYGGLRDLTAKIKDAKPGESYLLTTDGIHDVLTDDEISSIMSNHEDNPQAGADAIVAEAKARSEEENTDENIRPKKDDKKAIWVKIPDLIPSPPKSY